MQEHFEAEIQGFSLKGHGTAQIESGLIEVAHTVPGDRILLERTRKKRKPQKGRLLEILRASNERVPPKCLHAGVCGGCSWQQLSYEQQLVYKRQRVEIAFEGRCPVSPMVPCEEIYGYRNKMEFTFSENRAGTRFLGLMIAQAEPYVFNVEECHLAGSWMGQVLQGVREWWESSSAAAYTPHKDEGSLRYLTLREGKRTGQKMVVLNVSGRPEYALEEEVIRSFVQKVQELVSDASIFLQIHEAFKGSPTRFVQRHLAGPRFIVEKLYLNGETLSFQISPSSFFQPNTVQAEKLYAYALQFLEHSSCVFDLYSGTGTLALMASRFAKKVVAIELSAQAVADAQETLKCHGVNNCTVFQGDVGKVLSSLRQSCDWTAPDGLIVDPPRAGLDAMALACIKNLLPKKIVYISCNPITQAENIRELLPLGYQIQVLQPFDQFPHTPHIENVAFLELAR